MQSTIIGFCWSDMMWKKSFEFRERKDFLCPSDSHFQLFVSTIVSTKEFMREIEETGSLHRDTEKEIWTKIFLGKYFFFLLFIFLCD